jgi:hypothetical protein
LDRKQVIPTYKGPFCRYSNGACLIRSMNCLPFASIWVHPVLLGFFYEPVLVILLVFCVVLLYVFTFWVPCCGVYYDFRIKTMFSSSLPKVVCMRAHIICILYAFANNDVQHILRCVFVLFEKGVMVFNATFNNISVISWRKLFVRGCAFIQIIRWNTS